MRKTRIISGVHRTGGGDGRSVLSTFADGRETDIVEDWHVHVHRQQSCRQLHPDNNFAAPGSVNPTGCMFFLMLALGAIRLHG